MEINYIRKLTSSHMIVEQRADLKEWEEQMAAHAAADHLMFAERVRENEKTNLWYDITGKQSLDVILETRELKYDFLCELLSAFCSVVESVENILLVPDGLLLVPECIFRDGRTQKLFFCYYPGNEQHLPEAFASLLEYLLARLDHGDERAVTLAYGIYERFAKGGEGLGVIKELLRMPYEQDQAREESGEGGTEEEAEEETGDGEQVYAKPVPKETAVPLIAAKPGKRERLRLSIPSIIPILEKYGIFNGSRQSAGKQKSIRSQKIRRTEREETFVFEPEEEEEQIQARPTVLLGAMAQKPEGILRYEGRGACGDLTICGDTCVIGSEPGCDGYIPSTTVSRKHARITKKEGIYFIEDLNSSNGTSVGGELLNYKTKVSLQKNEVIVFADEKFRFV